MLGIMKSGLATLPNYSRKNKLKEESLKILSDYLGRFRKEGRRVFASSSFQTQSVPLLHLLSTHFPWVKIVFIDTGFLFAETYAFKKKLENEFSLNLITVKSTTSYAHQASAHLFQYANDTAYCCHLNKVEPIETLLHPGDVWISGVRRDQTSVRKMMEVFETDKRGVLRLHPMLDWNAKNVYDYIRSFKLPKHPLELEGYVSIGCVPCTHKHSLDGTRGGRWVGSAKTECGLHTNSRTV